jgi:hypothetical protein
VRIFFYFFQTFAPFGHPKVKNLVQDKVFFQIKITQMGILNIFFRIIDYFILEMKKYINFHIKSVFFRRILRIFGEKSLTLDIDIFAD